jgi:hypothetical protein
MLGQAHYMISKAIVKNRWIIPQRNNGCIEWTIPRLEQDGQKVFIVEDPATAPAYPDALEALPLKECYCYGTSTTNQRIKAW